MSKAKRYDQENLFGSMASILVPEEFLKDFEVTSVEDKPGVKTKSWGVAG